MFDLDLWREIFQSINKNRTRSILAGFTVAFAIMLFAILFGIANGLQNTFTDSVPTMILVEKHFQWIQCQIVVVKLLCFCVCA